MTRAKQIERLTLWLGLPLLLLLLSLTAGIVNYSPVRPHDPTAGPQAEPAESAPTIPLRPDRLVPAGPSDDAGQSLMLDDSPSLG